MLNRSPCVPAGKLLNSNFEHAIPARNLLLNGMEYIHYYMYADKVIDLCLVQMLERGTCTFGARTPT